VTGAIKQKGFTLIELLVVVAIIGILAAVGVVAYSGYTASAKKAAAKSNHKTAIKVIQAKFAECDINGEILLKSTANSSTVNTVSCSSSVGSGTMAEYIANHLNNGGFKNPYNNNQGAFAVNTNDVGQTWLGAASNSGITFYTFITKIDSNSSNNLSKTFDDPRD